MDYDRSWSSQEWKSEVTAHDRSGKPEKTSWDMMQKVAPHREEPLIDGTASSLRYGETHRDRSRRLDFSNSQEVANSPNFVIGSDAAESVKKVNVQDRKKDRKESPTLQAQERNIQ